MTRLRPSVNLVPFETVTSSKPPPLSPSQLLKRRRSIGDTPPRFKTSGKKRQKKTVPFLDDNLDSNNGINDTLGTLDRHDLADYLLERTKNSREILSLEELEEKRIPGTHRSLISLIQRVLNISLVNVICDTSKWQRPRTLENLPEFIQEFSSTISEFKTLAISPNKNGSPHTIVVTAAGLRAADITRYCYPFPALGWF